VDYSQTRCNECGRAGTQHCSRCGTLYCSRECQSAAWRHHHRDVCLSTPAEWSAWIQRHVFEILSVGSVVGEFGLPPSIEAAERRLGHMDNSIGEVDAMFAATIERYVMVNASPLARALQTSGCSMATLFVPMLARLAYVRNVRHATHRTFLETAYRPSLSLRQSRAIFERHADAGKHECVLAEPYFRWCDGDLPPDVGQTMVPLSEAVMIRAFDHPSAPTIYSFDVWERAPTTPGGRPADDVYDPSADDFCEQLIRRMNSTLESGSLAHKFLVVCMNKTAFLVQSFHAHYTYAEWLAFDRPLVMCPAITGGARRYPLREDTLVLRAVLPRSVMLDSVALAIDLLTSERSSPATRAGVYSDLTGLVVPPIASRFVVSVTRANIASLL